LILVIVRSSKKAEDCDMMKLVLAFALSLLPLAAVSPAAAQQRTLTIFGDDKCPSDTICVVAPETERFRIPKPFREGLRKESPANTSWAVRSQRVVNEGKTGTDSCSTVGGGGWTGCFMKQLQESYSEKKPEPEVP